MPIIADIQKLEPGDEVILFELDATALGATHQRFHGYAQSGPIWWQGNEYQPWAIEAEGFARTANGQQPAPTFRIGNIGEDQEGNPIPGVISSLCLSFDDLVGARVIRRRTLAKYLDSVNFPGGNPAADPNEELPQEIWLVEQKSGETSEVVEFTLSSPIDFDGRQLPGGQIIASTCPWLWVGGYRGPYCNYTGSAMFDRDDNPVSDRTQDRCGGRVMSCKKRFAAQQGVSESWAVINFGGFASADRLRG